MKVLIFRQLEVEPINNFSLFKQELGVEVIKNDEMQSLVKGMVFLQDNIKNACFTFTEENGKEFQEEESNMYP